MAGYGPMAAKRSSRDKRNEKRTGLIRVRPKACCCVRRMGQSILEIANQLGFSNIQMQGRNLGIGHTAKDCTVLYVPIGARPCRKSHPS